jgi:hypothetical protein
MLGLQSLKFKLYISAKVSITATPEIKLQDDRLGLGLNQSDTSPAAALFEVFQVQLGDMFLVFPLWPTFSTSFTFASNPCSRVDRTAYQVSEEMYSTLGKWRGENLSRRNRLSNSIAGSALETCAV